MRRGSGKFVLQYFSLRLSVKKNQIDNCPTTRGFMSCDCGIMALITLMVMPEYENYPH